MGSGGPGGNGPGRLADGGAVAQLGERGLCKPEVVGSIPIGSTTFRAGRDEKVLRESRKVFRLEVRIPSRGMLI